MSWFKPSPAPDDLKSNDLPIRMTVNQESWAEVSQLDALYAYQQATRYLEEATAQSETLADQLKRSMEIQLKAEGLHAEAKAKLKKLTP